MSLRVPAGHAFQTKHLESLAVIGTGLGGRAGVESRRCGDHVEQRSCLIGVRYDARTGHRHQLGNHIARRIVQIKRRIGADCQNLARVRVHDESRNAVCAVDFVALLEILFQIALGHGVGRDRHVIAFDRSQIVLLAIGERVVLSVDFDDEASRGTSKVGVIFRFQPRLAFRLDAGKTDQLRKELSKGIVAFHVRGIGDTVAQLQRLQLVDHGAFHLALELHLQAKLFGLRVGRNALHDVIVVEAEHLGDLGGDANAVVRRDGGRVREHAIGGSALREHEAVAVYDLSALGGKVLPARPLYLCLCLQLRPLNDHDLREAKRQQQHQQTCEYHQQHEFLFNLRRGGRCFSHWSIVLSLDQPPASGCPPPPEVPGVVVGSGVVPGEVVAPSVGCVVGGGVVLSNGSGSPMRTYWLFSG